MATDRSTSHALDYARSVLGDLPAHWRYARIGDLENEGVIEDVQDGNHGERHPKSSDYVTTGVPFIMAKDIINNRLNLIGCSFISRELADSLRIGFARPGDVLLTHKATMGRVAIVPEGYDYVMLTPQVTYYRINNKKQLDARYLKYAFVSPRFQHQLNASSDQSTRKFIGITAQRGLWFPLPSPLEQERIAEILGTLDDKIELNRRMNETLEAMARRLFRSWFVDFDPIHAKAAFRCEHPKLSNADLSRRALPNMAPEIAELFPDTFEDSTLGPIPKGWSVGTIGDLSVLDKTSLTPHDFPDELFDHYSIPAFDDSKNPVMENGDQIKSNKFVVTPNCVLLTKLNPRIPRVWLPFPSSSRRSLCSTEFLVLKPTPEVPREFLFSLVSSRPFFEVYETMVTGTSGSHQRIRPEHLLKMDVVMPEKCFRTCFAKAVGNQYALSDSLRKESRKIATTRDRLLPKLLSGELNVGCDSTFVGALE